MEIERKFLLDKIPFDLTPYRCIEIEQAYISTDPVIRLRRSDLDFFLTIKQGGNIAHEEAEFSLTEDQFAKLWKKIETNSICKTRCCIPLNETLTAELDIYHGALFGLLTVEVEFDSLDQAMSFEPPAWFGRDISENPRYKNNWLAVSGKPEES